MRISNLQFQIFLHIFVTSASSIDAREREKVLLDRSNIVVVVVVVVVVVLSHLGLHDGDDEESGRLVEGHREINGTVGDWKKGERIERINAYLKQVQAVCHFCLRLYDEWSRNIQSCCCFSCF